MTTKARRVRIYKRGDRGFHGYGRPIKDSNGGTVNVYESSAASGPHVWLNIDASVWFHPRRSESKPHDTSAHLNAAQARELIARLETWLEEIPERWGRKA